MSEWTLQKMLKTPFSTLLIMYFLRIIKKLPNRLKFLILAVVPLPHLNFSAWLVHFSWKVPSANYTFHSSSEKKAFSLNRCKNWSCMLSNRSNTLNSFINFLYVPNLHSWIFWNWNQKLLIGQEAKISYSILMLLQTGNVFIIHRRAFLSFTL